MPFPHSPSRECDEQDLGSRLSMGDPQRPRIWALVEMSSQIALCLSQQPDLLTQPFNGSWHRDLVSLNLHAWLLGSRQSNNKASLTSLQQELRLLKDPQPGQSMKRIGPFCSLLPVKEGGPQVTC